MNLKEQFITKNAPARPGIAMQEITSITIHWIGPYPKQSVQEPINWWTFQGLQASAHFVVKDEDVINCIPTSEVAWHCGCNAGNYHSIGIEVVPMNTDGQFSQASIDTLKELLKTLPKVELKRHYDWTKKDCPRYYTPIVTDGDAHWAALVKELQNDA